MNKPVLITVDAAEPDSDFIRTAVEVLLDGGVLILPTDTVYGVGALPNCTQALEKIYAMKQRPHDKPLPQLLAMSWYRAHLRGALSDAQRRCTDTFWPGALTVIVDVDGDSIGYRVPDHPVTLALLEAIGQPLAVTSANRSGDPEAHTAEAAQQALPACDAVMDAGPSPGQQASTVIRFCESGFDVLRQGSVSKEALEKVMHHE